MAPMHPCALGLITLRREIAARYARTRRLWLSARSVYRRLAAAPVVYLSALLAAAARLAALELGRSALISDLKALSD